MSEHLQTVTKVIELKPFWKNNNYEGYSNYISDVSRANKIMSELFLSDDVEVVSIRTTISINLKEKAKDKGVNINASNESLDTNFWVDVATGKYSD